MVTKTAIQSVLMADETMAALALFDVLSRVE
jgi:hypothetical protein